MSNKLNPCPFCGQSDAFPIANEEAGFVYVSCKFCGAHGRVGQDEKQAIQHWNERADSKNNRKPPLDLCPRCGSQKISVWAWEGTKEEPGSFEVQCDECGKSTGFLNEKQQALDAWANLQ